MVRAVLAAMTALPVLSSAFGGTEYLRMAITARQEGLYALSNEQLDSFFSAEPNHPNADYALLLYASNLFELKEYPETKRRLRTLLAQYPNSVYAKDALGRLALVCLETGDLAEALEHAVSYRARYGRDEVVEGQVTAVVFSRAVALFTGGNLGRSEELLKDLREKFPDCAQKGEVSYYLGLIFYRQNRFDRAAEFFKEVPDRVSNPAMVADACLKIGDCAFNEGKLADAEAWYRKVVTDYPGFPLRDAAYLQMGRTLKRMGRYADAEAGFLRACDVTTSETVRAVSLDELGRLAMLQERWDAAEKFFQRIVDDVPSSPQAAEALLQLGFVNFNAKRYDRAVGFFQKYLDGGAAGGRPDALFGMGYAYYRNKQVDKATAVWNQLLREFPSSRYTLEALFILGRKAFEQGQFATAEEKLGRLLRDFPQERFALTSYPFLIESLIEQKKYAEAKRVCEEALAKEPTDELRLLYGKVLAVLKEYAAAEKVLAEIGAENPDRKAEALYYLGQVCEATGRPAEARQRYLEIITFYPSAKEWCDLARGKLRSR